MNIHSNGCSLQTCYKKKLPPPGLKLVATYINASALMHFLGKLSDCLLHLQVVYTLEPHAEIVIIVGTFNVFHCTMCLWFFSQISCNAF